MALRTNNGDPIETEPDWLSFFVDTMKFPPKSATKYARYLAEEGFTGDVLQECINDADMKTNIGMLMGEYKKLQLYIKSSLAQSIDVASGSHKSDLRISKIPRPMVKMDSTQLEFDQFLFEWGKYKVHYRLYGEEATTNLYFCCSEDVRQHIRTKQSCLGSESNWEEQEVLDLIKDIVTSKVSPIVHVQEFINMKQNDGEKCQDFFRRLQVKASCCNFVCSSCNASNLSTRVKEKFILGVRHHTIQRQLLKTESITPNTPMSKILTEAITLEQSINDQAVISNEVSTTFAAEKINDEEEHDHVEAINRTRNFKQYSKNQSKSCVGCGSNGHKSHERSEKCWAWKLKCNNCANTGHIAKVCRQPKTERNVKLAEMSCMCVGDILSLHLPVLVKPMNIDGSAFISMDMFPDTGANICLIGPQQLKALKMKRADLNKCKHSIKVAGGSFIVASGWFKAKFKLRDKLSEQFVYFADRAKRFFLSRHICIDLGVVPPTFPFPPTSEPSEGDDSVDTLECTRTIPERPKTIPYKPCKENIPKLRKYLVDSYANSAFNKSKPFPKLSTTSAHIHLKPNYIIPPPAFWPAKVAEHWVEEVRKSLEDDVESGILIKVPFNEPTTWCARMVIVSKKDGRPRRTVDYQQLNSQCLREPNHTDSPFNAARRIPSRTWKSVLDAVDGYHSVALDEESSKLTTFITPWGRFRYLRFPQGHCSAGDAFNGRVQQILAEIPRMVRVVDDVCIYDDTIEGAFWHIWDFLEVCAKNGIVINESKLQFCQEHVDFAGLSVTSQGVQPSTKITNAIRNFPPPTDLSKARSFFGLVNQVNWAYANCTEMAPFRRLVKPNACFEWTDDLKLLFEKCKLKILDQVRDGVTKYDINRMTCLQTDFSKQGLGYLLLQKYCNCGLEKAPLCCTDGWRLVFAGSRFTKGAEQNYAPTEGELLAVAWALGHSHIFTKGCPNLIISTDHKPLLGILNEKPLENIKNPRIIRLKENTLPFHFTVQYNKGKWHRGPDALSRSPQCEFFEILHLFQTSCENEILEEQADGIMALAELALAELDEDESINYKDVQQATSSDSVMTTLITTIKHGFPNTEHLTDSCIRNFFNVKEHLWISKKGLVMFKKRIVVPPTLRKRVLKLLHLAHQGVDGMKARAAKAIYWPGINAAITRERENCVICNRIQPSQPREPIQMLPAPAFPFQQLCMDAFELDGHNYIAAVDKFTNWITVFHIKVPPKSKHVIESLRSIFTSFGTPEKLFSDGGLPFQASDVKEFLARWKVDHVTSSASYPQGNGRAELAVKTAKRILRNNTSNGSLNCDKASRALLQFRNTPIKHVGLSPAQLLFHRNIRDGIPVDPECLRPNKLWVIAAQKREEAFAERNRSLISKYNRSTRELPVLGNGTDVSIQDSDRDKRWSRFGVIVDRCDRKYLIRMHGSGRVVSRNRRFIKPVVFHNDDIQSTNDSCSVDGDMNESGTSLSSQTQTNVTPHTPRTTSSHTPQSQTNDDSQDIDTPIESPTTSDGSHPVNDGMPDQVSSDPNSQLSGRSVSVPRMLKRLLPFNKPGLSE